MSRRLEPVSRRVREAGARRVAQIRTSPGYRGSYGSRALALQRAVGNHAVWRLRRQADAGTTAPASDPAVDALDLEPKAKDVALKLKTKYPAITFTSGKRSDVSDQARAMAGNVVANRNWITETYKDKTLAKRLQDWLDANPKATSKDDIKAGLEGVMATWTDAEKGKLSAHFSGEAFDIQPQTDKASEITADADAWAKAAGGQFLEKEGGLVRWHVQVRE